MIRINKTACVASVLAATLSASAADAWIGDGRPARDGVEWYAPVPAPEFRTTFEAKGGVTLRIASPCYLQVRVNGEAVGPSHPLGNGRCVFPLWSPVDHTVYEETFDVPADRLVKTGKNEITVLLGKGWYDLPPLLFWSRLCFREEVAHGCPCFRLTVDGATTPLVWKWRDSDVLQNSVYLGAVVDRTRGGGSDWSPAVEVEGPRGRIVPREAPEIAYAEEPLAGSVRWLKEGETAIVDFGRNATGVPSFEFCETVRGQSIEIVYGERLDTNGTVNVLTQTAGQIKRGNGGPGAPRVAAQRDVLVCGGGRETFVPPFTWHVCRYAEIRGIRSLPAKVELWQVSSKLADTEAGASFSSPYEPRYEQIHRLCRATFKANLVGVQSDCPGRERLGYGGDIVATCEAMMLNYDMRAFYLKTLQDFADEAAGDGWITETAPYVGVSDRGFSKRAGPISWTLAMPVLMDGLLRHYGEKRALDFYPVLARYIPMVDAKFPDGVIPQCIGDHEALDRVPDEVTATAHWHEFVRLTATFADRLGKEKDAVAYRALCDKIRTAFQTRFVKNGIVANGSQSAQALGLYLGLIPKNQRAAADAALVKALEATGYGPTTGIFTTRYMLLYLSSHGHHDLAKKVVLHAGYPGWLYMLKQGATTLWETWRESDNTFSNCHPMFGSVDEWILLYGRDERPRQTLLVHPDEFTDAWIDRAASIGCDGLFLHPVGGEGAEASAKNLVELLREPTFRARIDRARARGLEIGYELHVGSWLLPRRLFAEHPEYFRLDGDGKRTPKTNFCLSNERAMDIAAGRAVELARALYGSSHRYFFWLDDVRDGTCRCEKCRALSASDQQLLFANRIVGELRKTIPDAQLCYLAYLGTIDVPERVKPAQGIFLEYAPIDRDMKRPLSEQQRNARLGSLEKLLEKFGRKDARVLDYWLDNSLLSGWKKPPKEFVQRSSVVWNDLAFYRELGFEDIATFACYLGDDYEKLWGKPDVTSFAKGFYSSKGGFDRTDFSWYVEKDRFRFHFNVSDSTVHAVEGFKTKRDIERGDRVEIFFSSTAELTNMYYCAEIDPKGRVLDYGCTFPREFDYAWSFRTLENSVRLTDKGYVVDGSVSVAELKSLGIDPRNCWMGAFRADFDRNEDLVAWYSKVTPGPGEADFHRPCMFFRQVAPVR